MNARRLGGSSKVWLIGMAFVVAVGRVHAVGGPGIDASAPDPDVDSAEPALLAQASRSTRSRIWRARDVVEFAMSKTSVNVGELITIALQEFARGRTEFEEKVRRGAIGLRILSGGKEQIRRLLSGALPSDPRVVDDCYLYESSLHRATTIGAAIRVAEPTINWLRVGDGNAVADERYVVWLEEAGAPARESLELLHIPIKGPEAARFLDAGIEVIVRKPTDQQIDAEAIRRARSERDPVWKKQIEAARLDKDGCPTWSAITGEPVLEVAMSSCRLDLGGS
jgi:hypothetical protein